MRWRAVPEPDMYDYNYDFGFGNPYPGYRQPPRQSNPLQDAKEGARYYLSIYNQIKRENEKAEKKKKEEDDKKAIFKMPTFTTGQMVGILMVSWPFIGMFERWAFNAVFH